MISHSCKKRPLPAFIFDAGHFVELPPVLQVERRLRELFLVDERDEERDVGVIEVGGRLESTFDPIGDVRQSRKSRDHLSRKMTSLS